MSGYNFTDEVRKALQLARESALELGHPQVTPAHLLLGVTDRPGNVFKAVLADLGTDPTAIRRLVMVNLAADTGRESAPTGPDLPYTRRAKQVLEAAMTEARELGHGYVGAEHLLLALMVPKATVGDVFQQLGITLDQSRAALLGQVPAGSELRPSAAPTALAGPARDVVARRLAAAALTAALTALALALLR